MLTFFRIKNFYFRKEIYDFSFQIFFNGLFNQFYFAWLPKLF